jgi:hypothetical protein
MAANGKCGVTFNQNSSKKFMPLIEMPLLGTCEIHHHRRHHHHHHHMQSSVII